MLLEIKRKLGFELIGLGHGIRISLIPGIKVFDASDSLAVCITLSGACRSDGCFAGCYQFSAVYRWNRARPIKPTFRQLILLRV